MPRLEFKDLIQNESFIKASFENQSEMVLWFDSSGTLLYANNQMQPFLQSVEDPYSDHQYLKCFTDQDKNTLKNILKGTDESLQKVVFRLRKDSESEFQDLEFRVIFIDEGVSKKKTILMIGKEIFTAKKSIVEPMINNHVFQNLFQFLPDFILLIKNNLVINSNDAFKNLFKINSFQDKCTLDSIFEDSELLEELLGRQELAIPSIRLKVANEKPLLCKANVIYLISNDSNLSIMFIRNRTEIINLKNKCQLESIRYRTLFENMQTGMAEQIVIFDEQGIAKDLEYIDVNPAFEVQTGLKNVIGKTIHTVMPNFEDLWFDMFVRVAQTGKMEWKENYVFDVGRWYSVFVFSTGPNKVAQIFLDITNQKNLEANLISSLQERNMLVKELHHRVQNNLLMIKGIIDMQQMRINDPKIQLYLQEIKARVQAMGQAHLSLYTSDKLSSINFESHLNSLVREVASSFDKEVDAEIKIKGGELQLSLDQSVALSIAINELLSNSFKFAFKDQKKGKILIDIESRSDSFTLIYEDYGEGYPTIPPVIDVNLLGLNLVQNLIHKQLKGQITFSNHNGARVELIIPRIVN